MLRRVLLTGGNGFIGGWIAHRLALRGCQLRVFDVREDRSLMAALAGSDVASQAEWRIGDIGDTSSVLDAVTNCDAIVHLAGVLTPACRADPLLGARVNLMGTLNVFEAAKRHGIQRLAYTSSAGVYGPDDGRTPRPTTHYGAFKLACEGSARAYFEDHGLASVGFRPFVVYGPGRTSGLTAGPTLACRAAARDEVYIIPYCGSAGLVFADDVAAALEAALFEPPSGAPVFNLPGQVASTDEVISAIRQVVRGAQITAEGPDLPFAPDVSEENLRQVFPELPSTSLQEGIARTIAFYRSGA